LYVLKTYAARNDGGAALQRVVDADGVVQMLASLRMYSETPSVQVLCLHLIAIFFGITGTRNAEAESQLCGALSACTSQSPEDGGSEGGASAKTNFALIFDATRFAAKIAATAIAVDTRDAARSSNKNGNIDKNSADGLSELFAVSCGLYACAMACARNDYAARYFAEHGGVALTLSVLETHAYDVATQESCVLALVHACGRNAACMKQLCQARGLQTALAAFKDYCSSNAAAVVSFSFEPFFTTPESGVVHGDDVSGGPIGSNRLEDLNDLFLRANKRASLERVARREVLRALVELTTTALVHDPAASVAQFVL
jgi:hypothetical protein